MFPRSGWVCFLHRRNLVTLVGQNAGREPRQKQQEDCAGIFLDMFSVEVVNVIFGKAGLNSSRVVI